MSLPGHNHPPDPLDTAAGIRLTDDFERFRQRDDVFTRAFWDEGVRTRQTDAFFASYRIDATPRKGEGFQQKDFALRNAAWLVSDVISNRTADEGRRQGFQAPIAADTPVAPVQVPVEDPERMAVEVKRIARFFGADLCGITGFDPRWIYATQVDTRDFS
ncbi:MAG: reductive dehalogenase, partial [Maritimibacter sp.]|nr:reductive dehalogenase [Maritimibacter sp.]